MLEHFLEHRKEVVTRRTRYDLARAEERAHILEGLVIALDHLDEVIKTIRAAADPPAAKAALMEKFGLSELQAQAILDMRLQRLTALERDKIVAEYKEVHGADRAAARRSSPPSSWCSTSSSASSRRPSGASPTRGAPRSSPRRPSSRSRT